MWYDGSKFFVALLMEKRRQKSTNVIVVFIEAYGRLDKDKL